MMSGGEAAAGQRVQRRGLGRLLLPEIERQQVAGKRVTFRADAAFANPEIYEALEERGAEYVVRIPAHKNLKLQSCHRFGANEVRLQLAVLAYNLGNLWRWLGLPRRIERRSLTSLQDRLMQTGKRLVRHARYDWLLLAEGHLNRRLFGDTLHRIRAAVTEWVTSPERESTALVSKTSRREQCRPKRHAARSINVCERTAGPGAYRRK